MLAKVAVWLLPHRRRFGPSSAPLEARPNLIHQASRYQESQPHFSVASFVEPVGGFNAGMTNCPTPCMSKWATFRAAWKASEGPRGRAIDPTLYSEECLAKWLPLKLSTGLPALLWLLVFYDLFFLIVGLEGTAADWLWWIDGVYVPYPDLQSLTPCRVLFFWLSSCTYAPGSVPCTHVLRSVMPRAKTTVQ